MFVTSLLQAFFNTKNDLKVFEEMVARMRSEMADMKTEMVANLTVLNGKDSQLDQKLTVLNLRHLYFLH